MGAGGGGVGEGGTNPPPALIPQAAEADRERGRPSITADTKASGRRGDGHGNNGFAEGPAESIIEAERIASPIACVVLQPLLRLDLPERPNVQGRALPPAC